jgi:signal transduction histidine kinase
LGLSISYGIVKRHYGKMDVRSKVGVGTTFVIELPIYRGREDENE